MLGWGLQRLPRPAVGQAVPVGKSRGWVTPRCRRPPRCPPAPCSALAASAGDSCPDSGRRGPVGFVSPPAPCLRDKGSLGLPDLAAVSGRFLFTAASTKRRIVSPRQPPALAAFLPPLGWGRRGGEVFYSRELLQRRLRAPGLAAG